MAIQVIDVGWNDGLEWGSALEGTEKSGRRLLDAFEKQIRDALAAAGPLRGPAHWGLRKGASALNRLLGGNYRSEISELADVFGVAGEDVLVANLAYDLANNAACSTFVQTQGRPLHARNLDWVFPGSLLRSSTTLFHVIGAPSGDYAMVGWPGFFGALTGMAPGRFSVTVNFVRHAEASGPAAALGRAVSGYWPVPWLVRRAFDECASFDEAVRLLSREPVLSPVLLTLAGVERGEGVVIERGPDDYLRREPARGLICTTNHYVSDAYEDDNVDLSDSDSEERYDFLESTLDGEPTESSDAVEALSASVLASEITQHQVAMSPAYGIIRVAVPGHGSITREYDAQSEDEIRCPVSGDPISVTLEAGIYVCPDCEAEIVVEGGTAARHG